MSRITVEHNGIAIDWTIENPAVASRAVEAVLSLIANRAAPDTPPRRNRPAPRSRAAITPEFLAGVAQVYRDAPENGKIRAIRERYHCSAPSAQNYLYRARQAGLLEPSSTHGPNGRKPRRTEVETVLAEVFDEMPAR